MSVARGDEVGRIDRETMEWHRDDDATIRHMRARNATLEAARLRLRRALLTVKVSLSMVDVIERGEGGA